MALIVQKYGGNLLSTPEKVLAVANKIKKLIDQGDQVVAVVSAMGKTTDELIDLAYKVSSKPIRRELDMLLSVGERISMSLLSMALNDLKVPAKSFTGSQSGILTESDHTQARIYDVKPIRIEAELVKKSMIIIAGFQGVSHMEKDKVVRALVPYSLAAADVIGADDLEGLLSRHPAVERANFKLWLTRTSVIERILHNAELCETDFQVERIRRKLPLFVQNGALPRARALLEEHRLAVISGAPGIGKTDLAPVFRTP